MTRLKAKAEFCLHKMGYQPYKNGRLWKKTFGFSLIVAEFTTDKIEYKDLMQCNSGWYGGCDIRFYIYTDTRERAIKIASERLRQVKAEEHFRYPLLRRPSTISYGLEKFPLIHYHTGEIILEEDSMMVIEKIPADYRPKLKVVTMDELKERYKDLNNKEE